MNYLAAGTLWDMRTRSLLLCSSAHTMSFWRQFQRSGADMLTSESDLPERQIPPLGKPIARAGWQPEALDWPSSLPQSLLLIPHHLCISFDFKETKPYWAQPPCCLERARASVFWEIPVNYHTVTTLWTALFPITGMDTRLGALGSGPHHLLNAPGCLLLPFVTPILIFVTQ